MFLPWTSCWTHCQLAIVWICPDAYVRELVYTGKLWVCIVNIWEKIHCVIRNCYAIKQLIDVCQSIWLLYGCNETPEVTVAYILRATPLVFYSRSWGKNSGLCLDQVAVIFHWECALSHRSLWKVIIMLIDNLQIHIDNYHQDHIFRSTLWKWCQIT